MSGWTLMLNHTLTIGMNIVSMYFVGSLGDTDEFAAQGLAVYFAWVTGKFRNHYGLDEMNSRLIHFVARILSRPRNC